jgi:hypothetical protein
MTLSLRQKSAVEVTLRQVERAVREARRHLRAPDDGILTQPVPMPDHTRETLEALIADVLAEIEQVALQLNLEVQIEDPGRAIEAAMTVAWSDLHDTLSPRLGRYGEIDPALAGTLDPHLQHLIELTREIGRVARDQS